MKYDAFISYRHLEKDMYVAKKVHKALETTKIPRKIQKETGKKRIQRVFRDQEELPIGSDLGNNIEYALTESEMLVVICSPQTQESYWVMKEIDTFISLHGRENVLAVLVEGEPEDSFPPQLLSDENGNPVEPLAADVRGETKREINKKIKVETMRLAASILHCDYDDLRQRHRERRVRRNMTIATGVAILGVAFGVYNAYNLARINENYQQKLINESKVIAATSLRVLEEGDRKTAALIALEGLPKSGDDRPLVQDDIYALSQALGTYELGSELKNDLKLRHNMAVRDFSCSSDGERVFSYDSQSGLYYWDTDKGELLFEKYAEYLGGELDAVTELSVVDRKPVVVTGFKLRCFEEDGTEVYSVYLPDECLGAWFDNKSKKVALSYSDLVEVRDCVTGEVVFSYTNEEEGTDFSSKIRMNEEGTYVAVDMSDAAADEPLGIRIIDTRTGNAVCANTFGDSQLDFHFTVDGYLAVASMTFEDLMATETRSAYIQKFDLTSGELLFATECAHTPSNFDNSYTRVRTRSYEDGNGIKHDELVVSLCSCLYTLDLNTGEVLATCYPDNDIEAFRLISDNNYAYVGTISGKVYVVNATTGTVYTDNTIEVADSLIHFAIGANRLISSGYRSSDITLMKALEDDTIENLATMPTPKDYQLKSPGENYMVISRMSCPEYGKTTYYIYDTTTGELKKELVLEGASYSDMFFLDNKTVVFPVNYEKFYYYDIAADKGEEASFESKYSLTKDVISVGGKRALFWMSLDYKLVDVVEKKELQAGTLLQEYDHSKIINEAVLPDTGDIFYYINYDGELFKADMSVDDVEPILTDYRAIGLRMTEDGSKLLISCVDGVLRVVDAQSLDVLDEVKYYATLGSGFVYMSEDGSKLYLQGSDLYLRIYDLNEKKFVYESDDVIEDIHNVMEDVERHTIAFRTSVNLYFMDTGSFTFTGKAYKGVFYLKKQNSIISINGKETYKFKVKSLEDLMGEVQKQFGDASLTEDQRRKYQLN